MIKPVLIAVVLLAAGGCANDPVPEEQLRLAEQSVAQAIAMGAAEEIPELVLAQQKLAAAHTAMQAQRYRQARLLAEQAELDARLAEALVLNEKSVIELEQLNRQIARLREQLGDPQ